MKKTPACCSASELPFSCSHCSLHKRLSCVAFGAVTSNKGMTEDTVWITDIGGTSMRSSETVKNATMCHTKSRKSMTSAWRWGDNGTVCWSLKIHSKAHVSGLHFINFDWCWNLGLESSVTYNGLAVDTNLGNLATTYHHTPTTNMGCSTIRRVAKKIASLVLKHLQSPASSSTDFVVHLDFL